MEGPSLPVRRIAFLVVLLLIAVSLPLAMLVNFQLGGYTLALAALVGGVCRAVLPDSLCLGLLVRSRQQDVITMIILGVALALLTWRVPGG